MNKISILISAYGGQAKRELSDVEKGIQRLGGTAAALSSRMALLGGAGAAGMALLGGAALKASASMEQTRVSFATLLKSSDQAKASLRELSKFAAETPFEFRQVTTAAKQLLAYGFSAKQLIPTLNSVGDAVSAVGAGAPGMEQVIRALGQMRAKGKVSQEELNQIGEIGLNAARILQEEFNLTAQEMGNIGAAGLDVEASISAILAGFDRAFGGGMQAQAKTMNGIISNLSDVWSQFLSNADATGLGDRIAQEAKPALEELLKSVERLKKDGTLDEWAKNVGDAMGRMAKAAGDAIRFTAEHPGLVTGAAKWGALTVAISAVGTAVSFLVSGLTRAAGSLIALGRAAVPAAVGLLAAGKNATVLLTLAARFGGLVGVFQTIGAAIAGFISAPLALVAAGVAALAVAWTRDWFHIRTVTASFFGWFSANAPGLTRIWRKVTGAIKDLWSGLVSGIHAAWGKVTGFLSGAWKAFADAIPSPVKTAFEKVKGFLTGLYNHFIKYSPLGVFLRAIEKIKGYVESETVQQKINDQAYLRNQNEGRRKSAETGLTLDGMAGKAPVFHNGRLMTAAERSNLLQAEMDRAGVGKNRPWSFADAAHQAKDQERYATTNGDSPGAEKAKTVSEMDKWIQEDSVEREKAIRDYIRVKWGESAAKAFRVTNRRHNGYKAMDMVSANQKALTWDQLAEASREAGGLRNSNEVGRKNWSKKATGDHIHGFVPTEGQAAAFKAIDDANEKARRNSEVAGKAAGEAYADAVRRTLEREDSPESRRRLAMRELNAWGRQRTADSGGNRKALEAVRTEYDSAKAAIDARFAEEASEREAESVRPYIERMDAESKAREIALEGQRELAEAESDLALRRIRDRAQEMRDDEALTDARIESIARELAAWYEAERTKNVVRAAQLRGESDRDESEGRFEEAARKRAQAAALEAQNAVLLYDRERALQDLRRDGQETLRKNHAENLQRQVDDLENQRELLDAGQARAVVDARILDLRKRIAAVDSGKADPGSSPITEQEWARIQKDNLDEAQRREKEYQEERKRLAKQADADIAASFAHRITGALFGDKGNPLKNLLNDWKAIFRRWLEEMATIAIVYSGKINPFTGDPKQGGQGGIAGWLGDLFGTSKPKPALASAAPAAAAGIVEFPGGGNVPSVPGLPGGIKGLTQLFAKKMGVSTVGGVLGAGLLGAAVSQMLFGKNNRSGAGGGFGTALGMALGGPLGALGGGLLGGALGSLFKKKRKRSTWNVPTFTDINAYALAGVTPSSGGGSPQASAGPSMGARAAQPSVVQNVSQTIHNYHPRPLDALSQDLADRVGRAVKARG